MGQLKVSINALELVAAPAAVVSIDAAGRTPRGCRYALKCDNSAACAAANYWVAPSAAMREVLRIWLDEFRWREHTVHLVYIDTRANGIADALSKADLGKALKRN